MLVLIKNREGGNLRLGNKRSNIGIKDVGIDKNREGGNLRLGNKQSNVPHTKNKKFAGRISALPLPTAHCPLSTHHLKKSFANLIGKNCTKISQKGHIAKGKDRPFPGLSLFVNRGKSRCTLAAQRKIDQNG